MARAAVPHLHFQLMDTRSPAIAAGLPFRFARSDGSPGVPANGQPFSATAGADEQLSVVPGPALVRSRGRLSVPVSIPPSPAPRDGSAADEPSM